MAMSKYRIKASSEKSGGYIVLYLKDEGNGFSWEQIGRKYETKEAAQLAIDQLKGGADNDQNA